MRLITAGILILSAAIASTLNPLSLKERESSHTNYFGMGNAPLLLSLKNKHANRRLVFPLPQERIKVRV
jgi:hypothetical protein